MCFDDVSNGVTAADVCFNDVSSDVTAADVCLLLLDFLDGVYRQATTDRLRVRPTDRRIAQRRHQRRY